MKIGGRSLWWRSVVIQVKATQTHYEVFVESTTQRLKHRMTIELAPGQADGVLLSVARHEIGHAIGL